VTDPARAGVLVIGIGNDLRGDDGVGIEVARRLQADPAAGVDVFTEEGDVAALIEAWQGRDAVVVVDAMRSGAAPGTIRRLDASAEPLPMRLCRSSSTHAVGLGEAIELARAIERLPPRVVVYAVEGGRFDAGAALSADLAAVVPDLVAAVASEASALAIA
jgi:hydrogenase maturation protease